MARHAGAAGEASAKDEPRRPLIKLPRRWSACQWMGLLILLTGLGLILYSTNLGCGQPSDDASGNCDESYGWKVFDLGCVLIVLFCCMPCFALTEPEAFYDAFPLMKEPIQKRFGVVQSPEPGSGEQQIELMA